MQQIATHHGLALIEDACEAIGAEFNRQRAGSLGDIAVLGFYPNKQITTGEGGAVLTRNSEHARRLRSLRNQGRISALGWLDHAEIGYNYRLSDIACALGSVQLARIDEILAMRRTVAERYDALFKSVAGVATPPLALPSRKISWFVYVVRLPERANRDQVQSVLFEKGIASGRYFAPIHLQPAWQDHPSARQANLPITEFIARQTLALPFFNQIAPDEQAEVAEALSNAL